jgi:hypothetical protein
MGSTGARTIYIRDASRLRVPTRVVRFTTNNRTTIINFATSYNVSAPAVAAHIAEEYGSSGLGGNITDSIARNATEQQLRDGYAQIVQMRSSGTLPDPNWDPVTHRIALNPDYERLKLGNPAFADVGPANIQIATAWAYIQSHPDDHNFDAFRNDANGMTHLRDALMSVNQPTTTIAMISALETLGFRIGWVLKDGRRCRPTNALR